MSANLLEALTALDVFLLALASLLALVVSGVGLAIWGRLEDTRGLPRWVWLCVGAMAVGAGVWALGIATLLPLPPTGPAPYAAGAGGLALAAGVAGAASTLTALTLLRPRWLRLGGGALALGVTVALELYLGLAAFGWRDASGRDPALASQVLAAAVVGSLVLLGAGWMEAQRRHPRRAWGGLAALVALGTVPIAFHAAVLATRYAPAPSGRPTGPGYFLLDGRLGVWISGGAIAVLLGVLLAAAVDRRLREHQEETRDLRRSEDRFRSLIQASAQIVWTTAPNGEMAGEQPSWSQFTGQPPGAYRGWGWFNAIHPDDRESTASLWQESLANRKPVELEHRVRRFDGQYRDCVARMVPVLKPDGSVREWVGTHSDVTERARMQEERELLAGAGRVLSSSLDERETLGAIAGLVVPQLADWCAIDLRTPEGRAERVVATHADTHLSNLLMQIELSFTGEGREHGIARVLATGESEMIREVKPEMLRRMAADEENYRRLNDVGVTSLISVPLTARDEVLGVISLALVRGGEPYDLRDLALAEELARRSAIAIENARLYSAARDAIQARDEMMSIVSHDLRNPLSTITMTADLLVESPPRPGEERRHLETIRRAARAMNRLIQDLLDVSQTESGSLAVDPHPVEPGPLAEQACDAISMQVKEKGLHLACDVDGDLPVIMADAARIQQVLSNLLGNAVKFVGSGGQIRLTVRARGERVVFSVEDNGPGIPPEDLPRVFDRHWRAKPTAHLGAGLGLAISKAIVEAHGGEISVESEPGRGTCFRFSLPARVEAANASLVGSPVQPEEG